MTELKLGDKVKLKKYGSMHNDWKEHKGEIGTIHNTDGINPDDGRGTLYECVIVWDDGAVSSAPRNSIIPVNISWKEEMQKWV
jgi:hypothetical protein